MVELNLSPNDWAKNTCLSLVCVVVLWRLVSAYLKHRKYEKMLEKADKAGGEAGRQLRERLLSDDMKKRIGEIAGLSLVKVAVAGLLTAGALTVVMLMP